ncbi:MAG: RDD family protein [Planctomycetaceae bacterium]|nr:RDD family protein [Planctomycetaceae bacterium]
MQSLNRQRINSLDTVIRIVTPENIAFSYQLASFSQRAFAYMIDMVILSLIVMLIGCLLLFMVSYLFFPSGLALAILFITGFFLYWFLGAFFETVWNGQTPGKRLLGIRVLSTEGQPINSFQAFIRNIMRLADLQPVMSGGIAFAVMMCNKRFQRFGDLLCGTMVIVDENTHGRHELVKFHHPDIFRATEQLPLIPLPSETLKALALYVHRRKAISPRRREHIATLLAVPLMERHGLPENIHCDLLLCAIYHTQFVAMSDEEETETGSRHDPVPMIAAIQL